MSLNKRLLHHFDHCLNCNTNLEKEDKFCAKCGQKRTTGRISFRQLALQFFEDTINWDARLFKSIRGLFTPGKLTEEFFLGRHVPYWQPLRLFLFMATIQMLIVNTTIGSLGEEIQKGNDKIKRSVYEYIVFKKLDSLKSIVIKASPNAKCAKAGIDSLLYAFSHPESFQKAALTAAEKQQKIDSIRQYFTQQMQLAQQDIDSSDIQEHIEDFEEGLAQGLNLKDKDYDPTNLQSDSILISTVKVNNVKISTKAYPLKVSKLDFINLTPDEIIKKYEIEGLKKQIVAKQSIKAMKDGKSGIEFFLGRLSWMIIIMMPIFALFLELMNRPYYYVEHVIFSFHCHAFMFMLISLVFVLNHYIIPDSWETVSNTIIGLSVLYLLYYFYRAMRNVYKQSRKITLAKYTFLLFAYFGTTFVAFLFTMLLSFLFF